MAAGGPACQFGRQRRAAIGELIVGPTIMNDPGVSGHSPADQRISGRWILAVLGLIVIASIIYVAGIAGFIRWEERSATQAEFFRRVAFRNRLYAPVIWFQAHDSSGAIRALVQWEFRLAHTRTFDPKALAATNSSTNKDSIERSACRMKGWNEDVIARSLDAMKG